MSNYVSVFFFYFGIKNNPCTLTDHIPGFYFPSLLTLFVLYIPAVGLLSIKRHKDVLHEACVHRTAVTFEVKILKHN